jgi:hypothetical protein
VSTYRHGLTALAASLIAVLSGMLVLRGLGIFYAPLLLASVLTGYHASAAIWVRP